MMKVQHIYTMCNGVDDYGMVILFILVNITGATYIMQWNPNVLTIQ